MFLVIYCMASSYKSLHVIQFLYEKNIIWISDLPVHQIRSQKLIFFTSSNNSLIRIKIFHTSFAAILLLPFPLEWNYINSLGRLCLVNRTIQVHTMHNYIYSLKIHEVNILTTFWVSHLNLKRSHPPNYGSVNWFYWEK